MENLTTIEYNITKDEQVEAYTVYQKKHVYKKNWIKTVAFGVLAIGFFISSILYPDQAMNFIMLALCLGIIAIIWINTKKIRTSLAEAMTYLEQDKYVLSLQKNCFIIETIVSEEEKQEEGFVTIKPIEVKLDENVEIVEKSDMFVLILQRNTVYIVPKRCMNKEQEKLLKDTFSDKLKENFITEE